ncbi:kinase-like domain-containing protein [Mycena metata]|uniref:Kinase-like domain-containing protein n=1 Tax=Mycena metata TaxID=1033252 RepID=A0AAD7JBI8_9AGAR|nr:kinase-like domain-containing protein [Mycena metata]
MGVVKEVRRAVHRVTGGLFILARSVAFCMVVALPLSLGGDVLKIYGYKAILAVHLRARTRRNGVQRYELLLLRRDAAVDAVLNAWGRITCAGLDNLVSLATLTGYPSDIFLSGLFALWCPIPAPYQLLPSTSFLDHPELPFWNVARMLETALPGSRVYINPDRGARWEFWGCRGWERISGLDDFFPDGMVDPSTLRKVGTLGAGGFGSVVKRIARPRNNERDRWEAIISEVVTHWLMEDNPAFPRIHGAFQNRKFCFLILDCGKTSFACARPTDRHSAWVYSTQLADAVQALHQSGVVHFDLKPANLVLDVHGQLQVIDYGLVHHFDDDEVDEADWPEWVALRDAEPRTDAFPVLWPGEGNPHSVRARGGTYAYMCPEAEQGLPCSYAADVWAIGVIMYEWYAQASPAFQGDLWEPVSAHWPLGHRSGLFFPDFLGPAALAV